MNRRNFLHIITGAMVIPVMGPYMDVWERPRVFAGWDGDLIRRWYGVKVFFGEDDVVSGTVLIPGITRGGQSIRLDTPAWAQHWK